MKRSVIKTVATLIAVAALGGGYAFPYSEESKQNIGIWGTMTPYPDSDLPEISIPDSLQPVLISHIGRHGARYLSGSKKTEKILHLLSRLDDKGMLTAAGEQALAFVKLQQRINDGHWGALDSLGRAEENGIGQRMASRTPELFADGRVYAIASYVPRVVESMYSLTGALADAAPGVNLSANSGKGFSPLLRFFETDSVYKDYITSGSWKAEYSAYNDSTVPVSVAKRLVRNPSALSEKDARDITNDLYALFQGVAARGEKPDYKPFFTLGELEACARISNLEHYLRRTDHEGNNLAGKAATPLLKEMIASADAALTIPGSATALLRFGHAETLMPLFSLMNLPGCNALYTSDANLPQLWDSASVSPLGANLQLIYCQAPSGHIYVLTLRNERPAAPLPGNSDTIVPWESLKTYWLGQMRLAD